MSERGKLPLREMLLAATAVLGACHDKPKLELTRDAEPPLADAALVDAARVEDPAPAPVAGDAGTAADLDASAGEGAIDAAVKTAGAGICSPSTYTDEHGIKRCKPACVVHDWPRRGPRRIHDPVRMPAELP